MTQYLVRSILALACVSALHQSASIAGVTFDAYPLAPAGAAILARSADHRHAIYTVASKAGGKEVFIDDRSFGTYDDVVRIAGSFSHDGSRSVLHIDENGHPARVFVDGLPSTAFGAEGDSVPTFINKTNILACAAFRKVHVGNTVIDHNTTCVEGKTAICATPGVFDVRSAAVSNTGKVVLTSKANRDTWFELNGRRITPRDESPALLSPQKFSVVFAPDNDRIISATVAKGVNYSIRRDGELVTQFQAVQAHRVASNGDGSQILTIATVSPAAGPFAVFLNDQQIDKGDNIGFEVAMAKSRYAYSIKRGPSWYVVIDGKASEPYKGVGFRPWISDDGQHVAYTAQLGDEWQVIVDGKRVGPAGGRTAVVTFQFSPEGVPSFVQDGKLFVGEKELPAPRGDVWTFSPSGKSLVYLQDSKSVIVNGEVVSLPKELRAQAMPVFQGEDKILISGTISQNNKDQLVRMTGTIKAGTAGDTKATAIEPTADLVPAKPIESGASATKLSARMLEVGRGGSMKSPVMYAPPEEGFIDTPFKPYAIRLPTKVVVAGVEIPYDGEVASFSLSPETLTFAMAVENGKDSRTPKTMLLLNGKPAPALPAPSLPADANNAIIKVDAVLSSLDGQHLLVRRTSEWIGGTGSGAVQRSQTVVYIDGKAVAGIVGKIWPVRSPHGRFLMVAKAGNDEVAVQLDSQAGPAFEKITKLRPAADGSPRWTYLGERGKQRIAYSLDLQTGEHKKLSTQSNQLDVLFSADGSACVASGTDSATIRGDDYDFQGGIQRLAAPAGSALAVIGSAGNGQRVLIDPGGDGELYKASHTQIAGPVFSRDGKHVAYVAPDSDVPDKPLLLIIDGKKTVLPNGIGVFPPVFSADGLHLALRGQRADKREVLMDETGKTHMAVPLIGGSRRDLNGGYGVLTDGSLWALVTEQGKFEPTLFAVGNDLGQAYESIKDVTLSNDGGRVAAVVSVEGSKRVLLDGGLLTSKGSPVGPPMFSSDGRSLAYVAKKSGQFQVVLDDAAGEQYTAIEPESLSFSPDGKAIAYVASDGKRQLLIVNGVVAAKFEILAEQAKPLFMANNRVWLAGRSDDVWTIADVTIDSAAPFAGIAAPARIKGETADAAPPVAPPPAARFKPTAKPADAAGADQPTAGAKITIPAKWLGQWDFTYDGSDGKRVTETIEVTLTGIKCPLLTKAGFAGEIPFDASSDPRLFEMALTAKQDVPNVGTAAVVLAGFSKRRGTSDVILSAPGLKIGPLGIGMIKGEAVKKKP